MEAIILACKHMNLELKQPEITKLKKQKHASHQQVYRLKSQLKKLKMTNEILSAYITFITRDNIRLTNIVTELSNKINSE